MDTDMDIDMHTNTPTDIDTDKDTDIDTNNDCYRIAPSFLAIYVNCLNTYSPATGMILFYYCIVANWHAVRISS